MTLILSNEEVAALLSMPECIAVLEDAYRDLAAGRGVNRRRSDSFAPTSRPDALYSLKSMDGIVPGLGVGAVRINSDVVTWPTRGGGQRREKVPAAGGRYVGLVLLFSAETGEPLAIMPDGLHLSSIKRPEIEPAAIRRADRVVVHTHEEKPMHFAAAGVEVPEARTGKGWRLGEEIDFAALPDLASLVAGKIPGRRRAEEVTCFLNNIGMGYQFAAAGAVVYRKARERGVGRELPTEWFTQEVHP